MPANPALSAADNEILDQAVQALEWADSLVIAAGAGMGVDSGLPDFRGNEGFWKAYPALGAAGLDFASAASPRTFATDPTLAWGFYGHRLALYRETAPHTGFAILQRWARTKAHGAFVFTSNVDGQFQKAGFDEDRLAECHGTIHLLQCTRPCSAELWSASEFLPEVDIQACLLRNALPRCPNCGALARPNILMFGDAHWLSQRTDEQEHRMARWIQSVQRPLVIELGAGVHVTTVRQFSDRIVARGARLLRINPRDAETGPSGIGLAQGALAGLEAIDRSRASA